jgi:hypothetical protein
MSRTIEVLDRVTGQKTRRLLIDAREAVDNDPARYELIGKSVRTDIKAVGELRGSGPHALRVGALKFETEEN